MHRLLLALVAFVALVAASPPPAPELPAVMVYPLQTSAALGDQINARVVTVLANQIALEGHVRVLPTDPSISRSDYLVTARKAGAAFYVTGFLTPLGNGASIIEQLVSTQSGIVVFSHSGQIANIDEAVGQGDFLRQAILQQTAEHGYGSFAPAAQSANGNTAGGNGSAHGESTAAPEANIGGLFHHKRSSAAPASPSPSPVPSPSPAH